MKKPEITLYRDNLGFSIRLVRWFDRTLLNIPENEFDYFSNRWPFIFFFQSCRVSCPYATLLNPGRSAFFPLSTFDYETRFWLEKALVLVDSYFTVNYKRTTNRLWLVPKQSSIVPHTVFETDYNFLLLLHPNRLQRTSDRAEKNRKKPNFFFRTIYNLHLTTQKVKQMTDIIHA